MPESISNRVEPITKQELPVLPRPPWAPPRPEDEPDTPNRVATWKDGTPVHGSLREAVAIWSVMLVSCGFGVFIGWAVWHV